MVLQSGVTVSGARVQIGRYDTQQVLPITTTDKYLHCVRTLPQLETIHCRSSTEAKYLAMVMKSVMPFAPELSQSLLMTVNMQGSLAVGK